MRPANDPQARWRRLGHALAALLYLGLVLRVHAAVLEAPRTYVPFPDDLHGRQAATVYQGDQRFVVSAIAERARKLASAPTEIAGLGHCYPLRAAYTLGEHMLGEALLALPVYVATGDPILSYNAVVLLSVWLAALAMYALAFHFTRSIPAAFVAGLLFAFHPGRVRNPGHPFVHGNLWTPLALLFAHRLFAHERWRDAAALALFISLQLLESFYQVLGLTIIGGVFGGYLALRSPRRLPALAPKLALVALVAAATAWLVLGPYLETRDTWGVLQGRERSLLFWPSEYLPGKPASVGLVTLVLAALGWLDRLRGARRVDGLDPRLVLTLGGLLVYWSTLWPTPIRGTGFVLPSPLISLAGWVPGLDAVRVLRALRFGVYLVLAFVAAYGVLALGERLRAAGRVAVATLAAIAYLVEIFTPATRAAYAQRGPQVGGYRILPRAEDIRLVTGLPQGAVLDLPFTFNPAGKLLAMPSYLMLGAYHQQPLAACYNSFTTPLQTEVERLANRLPAPGAADALHALGFRTLIVHHERTTPAERRRLAPLLRDPSRIQSIGQNDQMAVYLLRSPLQAVDEVEVLALPDGVPGATGEADLEPAEVPPGEATIDFPFVNRAGVVFRHPTFEPGDFVATWRDARGQVVARAPARGLLPLAIAPCETTLRPFRLGVPVPPGRYQVELTTDGPSPLVLAQRQVVVFEPPGRGRYAPAASADSSSALGLVAP